MPPKLQVIASATVKIFGKEVTDPALQFIGTTCWIPFLLGGIALVLTQWMVDEERVRAEKSVASLFGRGFPPRRILSNLGRKVQTFGFVSVAVSLLLMFYLAMRIG